MINTAVICMIFKNPHNFTKICRIFNKRKNRENHIFGVGISLMHFLQNIPAGRIFSKQFMYLDLYRSKIQRFDHRPSSRPQLLNTKTKTSSFSEESRRRSPMQTLQGRSGAVIPEITSRKITCSSIGAVVVVDHIFVRKKTSEIALAQ